jgi:hypothetical protein
MLKKYIWIHLYTSYIMKYVDKSIYN